MVLSRQWKNKRTRIIGSTRALFLLQNNGPALRRVYLGSAQVSMGLIFYLSLDDMAMAVRHDNEKKQ